MPLCVGGGVRTVDDFRTLLQNGADKVAVNTAALQRPELIADCSQRFGAQCVVVAVDAKKTAPGRWSVFTHGGRRDTGRDAIDWAREAARLGAGEILLTSMDADGTRDGYDLELTRAVADAVGVPVIASGGAGEPQHLADAMLQGHADAALIASIVHYGEHPIPELKAHLREQGIEVR